MLKKIIAAIALGVGAISFCGDSSLAQTIVGAYTVSSCGGQSLSAGSRFPMSMDITGDLCVNASVSASISGFTPSASGARMTPLTVTTSDSSGSLPTGAVTVVSNVGATNPMYCNLNGVAATVADQEILAGSWFAFTAPSGVSTLHCIATGGSTTANGVGGAGLPTGAGGGSGSGGGGGGAVFGPTAVGSAAANPPVLFAGTANAGATGNVQVAKVSATGSVSVDGSGATQPISGAVTQGTAATITAGWPVTDGAGTDSTSTITGTGASTVNASIDGFSSAKIQIKGTYAGFTVNTLVSSDAGTTFVPIQCALTSGGAAATSFTLTANQSVEIACGHQSGDDTLQLQTSTGPATGTANIDISPSAFPSDDGQTVAVGAISAGSNVIGKVGIDQTTPGTTNGVQINAAIPAGTNLVGKVGIDQTTVGTTNGVSLAQIGTGTVATSATGVQKVGVVGNAGAVFDFAGQNAASPANSVLIGAQFQTTPTTVTPGNASPLQMDNAGNLLVNIKAGAGSGGTALADNAAWTAGTTSMTPIGCEFTSSGATAITTAHAATVGCTSRREAFADIEAVGGTASLTTYGSTPGSVPALPVNAFITNTNANGSAVSASSSPVVIASDQAAVAVKAASAAFASGSLASGAVVDITNMSGSLAATAPTKAEYQGGRGSTSDPTAVTDGQLVGPELTPNGKQVVQPWALTPNLVDGGGSSTGTGTFTILAASGSASLKEYITGLQCGRSDAGTTAITVAISEGTKTRTFVIPNNGGGGGNNIPLTTPIVFAANTAVTAAFSAGVTTGFCNAEGFYAP